MTTNENKVLACVDRSHFANTIADAAAWAAVRPIVCPKCDKVFSNPCHKNVPRQHGGGGKNAGKYPVRQRRMWQ